MITRFSGTIVELGPGVDTSKYAVGQNVAVYVLHLSPSIHVFGALLSPLSTVSQPSAAALLAAHAPQLRLGTCAQSLRPSYAISIRKYISRLQHIYRESLVVAVASPSTS